jgi:hypothetical protein
MLEQPRNAYRTWALHEALGPTQLSISGGFIHEADPTRKTNPSETTDTLRPRPLVWRS